MQKIFSEFSAGYSRFNVFYTSYLRAKRANSYANENWDSNGLYQRTEKALTMLRSFSISGASPSIVAGSSKNKNGQAFENVAE